MLTATTIRNAKPKDKQYKLSDGRGLYLLVLKSGKYFRWDYRFMDKGKLARAVRRTLENNSAE